MLPEWSHADIAALDRDRSRRGLRRGRARRAGMPHGRSVVRRPSCRRSAFDGSSFVAAGSVRARGEWTGRASQLSEDHVQWTFIDEIAAATRDPGRSDAVPAPPRRSCPTRPSCPIPPIPPTGPAAAPQRRRVRRPLVDRSRRGVPRDAVARRCRDRRRRGTRCGGTRAIHLAIFVHRVDGLEPGLYLLLRDPRQRRSAAGGAAAASFSGSRRAIRCRCTCSRAATAARWPGA